MEDSCGGLILIVTGSTLRAEEMDRPLAYYLQAQIQSLGTSLGRGKAVVLSDRCYLARPELHPFPVISVGGPGINRLARRLLKLPAVLAADDRFFIQMDHDGLRASIWGMDNPQTRIAVVTFAERYLPHFYEACWQRKS